MATVTGAGATRAGASAGAGAARAKPAAQPKPRATSAKAQSGTNLEDSNVLVAISYLSTLFISFVIPAVLYFVKKEDKFVRFHSLQAMAIDVIFLIISIVTVFSIVLFIFAALLIRVTFGIGMFLIFPIFLLLGLGEIALTLFLAYKAFQNEYYKLPAIGDLCDKYA